MTTALLWNSQKVMDLGCYNGFFTVLAISLFAIHPDEFQLIFPVYYPSVGTGNLTM